jgi:hypothetical protein
MATIDPAFPVFVLVGVLVAQIYYSKTVVPRVRSFKQHVCSNPNIVLHSRDIRRRCGQFAFLGESQEKWHQFGNAMNDLYSGLRVRLFASVIYKTALKNRFISVVNPYEVSISHLMSLVCGTPGLPGPWRPELARVIAEGRGKLPDKLLQAEYARFRNAGLWNYGERRIQNRRPVTIRRLFPGRIEFRGKDDYEIGLELADLAAYPIARAIINGEWSRQDLKVVGTKLEALAPFPTPEEDPVFPWDTVATGTSP